MLEQELLAIEQRPAYIFKTLTSLLTRFDMFCCRKKFGFGRWSAKLPEIKLFDDVAVSNTCFDQSIDTTLVIPQFIVHRGAIYHL